MSYQLGFTLISGVFIGGVAGYLGTLMLSKKMSVVAGPLAHLALPGVALALVYGFSISFGVFPFVILGAIFIWLLEKRTKLPMENLAAIVFAAGVGTALLILPIGKAEEALTGNVTNITAQETLAIVLISVLVFYIVRKTYKKIMLLNVHEDLAVIEGVNVSIYNLVYLLSIATVVAIGVYLVGGLITAALIAIPAASAKNISKKLSLYKILASSFGVIAAVSGILIARHLQLPPGPIIIILGVILFLVSVIFRRRSF